jgi:hypothetical protein
MSSKTVYAAHIIYSKGSFITCIVRNPRAKLVVNSDIKPALANLAEDLFWAS